MSTRSPDEEQDYVALAQFRHALRVFLRVAEEAARDVGLTPAQHQLLLAVKGHVGDHPSVTDIAETLQLRTNSTVELVRRAEAAGWLRRIDDPADRRRHLLALTPSGDRILAKLYRLHALEYSQIRARLAAILRELET